MTEDKIEDLIIQVTTQLAALNANMKSTLDKLSNHELRLTQLEQNKTGLKDSVIAWLAKGLVAAVLVIGSLTGASALIKHVLGL